MLPTTGAASPLRRHLAWPVSIAALCLGGLCWTLVRALPSRAQVQDLPEKWTVFGVPLELPDLSGALTHSRDLPINAADALTATCKAGIDRECASVTSSSFAKFMCVIEKQFDTDPEHRTRMQLKAIPTEAGGDWNEMDKLTRNSLARDIQETSPRQFCGGLLQGGVWKLPGMLQGTENTDVEAMIGYIFGLPLPLECPLSTVDLRAEYDKDPKFGVQLTEIEEQGELDLCPVPEDWTCNMPTLYFCLRLQMWEVIMTYTYWKNVTMANMFGIPADDPFHAFSGPLSNIPNLYEFLFEKNHEGLSTFAYGRAAGLSACCKCGAIYEGATCEISPAPPPSPPALPPPPPPQPQPPQPAHPTVGNWLKGHLENMFHHDGLFGR